MRGRFAVDFAPADGGCSLIDRLLETDAAHDLSIEIRIALDVPVLDAERHRVEFEQGCNLIHL